VSAIATYLTQSGKRRLFRCHTCETRFSETRETVFFDLRTSEDKVMMALKMLLVRVDLTGIGFVLGVTEQTVLAWRKRAAEKADEVNRHLLRHLPVTQRQLDEMWNFIERKHAQQSAPDGESLPQSAEGRQWIWSSYAPELRLMVAAFVGPRTSDSAVTLLHMTAAVVAGIPCFCSDGFSCYLAALVAVYHQSTAFARTGKRGRPRKPVVAPHPDLVYAQIVKPKSPGRLQTLTQRVRCGGARLVQCGLAISTSLIERLNLTRRHALAPLVRKSGSFCKDREQMRRRVVFFHAFYHFARPHQSLRVELSASETVWSGLIRPKWQQRTPGMAAGLTDHVWTFRELLTAKFDPCLYQSNSG
jgi:IS1 family transposase